MRWISTRECSRSLARAWYRAVAQALGRPEPAAQDRFVSLRHVDAEFLYQSRRAKSFAGSTRPARSSQRRVAPLVRQENRVRSKLSCRTCDFLASDGIAADARQPTARYKLS